MLAERPKNYDEAFQTMVPYPFKWRTKLGKVECDCVTVREKYEPWYGFTIYHNDECATLKHLRKYPQMENFMWDRDPHVLAHSE